LAKFSNSAKVDNCNTNASCTNDPGSFKCGCNPGYTGDGVTCTNVDECQSQSDDCHANASCSDTLGSFDCTCATGYAGNGKTCAGMYQLTNFRGCLKNI